MPIQKTIQELREQRKNKWDEARNFLDAKAVNGIMSEENEKIYEAMEREVVNLGKAIQIQERREKLDAELNAPTSTPITGKPSDNRIEGKSGRASEDYKKAFWDNIRKKNYYDAQNVLEIGTDDHGGYLVPDEYERTLIQGLEDANFFRSLAHVIRTDSGERKIPVVTDHGEAQWIDESGAYQLNDDEFSQETLSAYKLGTAIKVSQELLNDSVFNIPAYIAGEFARRIGAAEEAAFIAGNGVKKPTGVLTTAGTGYTTTTATISFDDVQELYYSLNAPYRKRASWILNDKTVKALRKLKDSNGNYLWQPSVSADIPDMIMSRPYYTSQYVPEIAAGAKVLIFGDYSYYWIPAYIYDWKQSHSGKVLKIVGNFGVSDDTLEIDDADYSMAYRNPDAVDVVLDFADCGIITAKSHQFAYFRNCTVRNLMLNYPDLSLSETTAMQNLIDIRDAALENCHIYGSLDGCEVGITCYHMLGGRLINCDADFASDNMLWGIMSSYDAVISGCSISVTGTAEETAAGISALNSHVSGSRFTAAGKTAYGGLAGGNYTECTFSGLGELNGYGFSVSGTLNAGNCIFTGYTKDTENGEGIGISAGSRAKILLHGMTCPENVVHGYSQTGSLSAADGSQGYYDGTLYTAPVLPVTDTVVTYTDFMPISVMTQASYDEITPRPNRTYILTEE